MRGLGTALIGFGILMLAGVVVGSITSGLPPVDVAAILSAIIAALFAGGVWLRRVGAAS
jgi:hypothetical protein